MISNCCSARIYDDMDICTKCKEHCGAVDDEGNELEMAGNQWKPVERNFSANQIAQIEQLKLDVNEENYN